MNWRVPMAAAEIDECDVQRAADVIRSGRLALGPNAEEFEALTCSYAGVSHGIAVSSGTAALHLLVRALGLGPGDEVLVPSFTFAASVNALLYERVTPVFVDIEADTFCLDPADTERMISPKTRAIMAVDVFGHPAEWDALAQIATRHDLRVIDDSCEAIGAEYKGRKIGQFGDAGAFAFYPNKQMTTGEGGIIVTNNDEIARLTKSMRNQGRGEMGAWLEHERLGYNYRLDEMSAALGVSQLSRLDSFLAKRDNVAAMYSDRLRNVDGVRVPIVRPHVRMSWFVYVVTLAEDLNRDHVMHELELQGIPSRGYFTPVHHQPYIREMLGAGIGPLPVTERMARRTVALPFHNNLSGAEVDIVADALDTAIKRVRSLRTSESVASA